MMEFEIVLEKQKEGYTVYVPKLPGCVSQGNTKKGAMDNIKEAIELYLEDLNKAELEELRHNIQIVKAKVKAVV